MSAATAASPRGDRLHPSRGDRLYWHLTALRRALAGVVERHLAGRGLARLVDYGCGNTPYRPLFAPHVGRYLACDLPGCPEAELRIAPDGGPLPLRDGCADVVLSIQVLEHVPDPARYLAECRRVLGPGGRLVLSTHGVWRFHPDPGDYWRFTSQGLRRVLAEAGLEVIELRGCMGPASTALQLLQDALWPRLPRVLRRLVAAPAQLLIELADRLGSDAARDRDACVYVLVARKEPAR